MRALLDTHTFLWWITDRPQLSARAREIISDGSNELFLSAASGWEIAIKILPILSADPQIARYPVEVLW